MQCMNRWAFRLLLATVLLARADAAPLEFPYKAAGLSTEQAAAHLLSRLAYGPRPGDVQRVVSMGLERWAEQQLYAAPPTVSVPASSGGELREAKVFRAVMADDQLREVMTEFWFNHFNVSVTDDDCRQYVAAYEHQAIRPHALGEFADLLRATARHPAMLYYLDNAYSSWEEDRYSAPSGKDPFNYSGKKRATPELASKSQGINENYARELLELHTLGVDGGYRQQDVTEVARAFTGWSVSDRVFTFKADKHDPGPKKFLFLPLKSSPGIAEGERVLTLLAEHPSTARFISRKLAQRFVADDPPAALVGRMARSFTRSHGDTRIVLQTLLESPEFWSPGVIGCKIKSPLEYTASCLRAAGVALEANHGAGDRLVPMGQDLYACRPPTGWSEKSDLWITPGTLIERMNFAFDTVQGRVHGVQAHLALPTSGRERTPLQALQAYAEFLLPGRDHADTVRLLADAARDPEYAAKVQAAARARNTRVASATPRAAFVLDGRSEKNLIGLLLGSPEFQRR